MLFGRAPDTEAGKDSGRARLLHAVVRSGFASISNSTRDSASGELAEQSASNDGGGRT